MHGGSPGVEQAKSCERLGVQGVRRSRLVQPAAERVEQCDAVDGARLVQPVVEVAHIAAVGKQTTEVEVCDRDDLGAVATSQVPFIGVTQEGGLSEDEITVYEIISK